MFTKATRLVYQGTNTIYNCRQYRRINYQRKFWIKQGKLVPSEVGQLVNEFLTNNFSNIIDYNFTASVEDDFDSIANGEKVGNQ